MRLTAADEGRAWRTRLPIFRREAMFGKERSGQRGKPHGPSPRGFFRED